MTASVKKVFYVLNKYRADNLRKYFSADICENLRPN